MTTKTMVAAFALLAGVVASAATPAELFAAKDWAGIVEQCTYAQITNRLTTETAPAIFDAALASTNGLAADCACALARDGFGDPKTAFDNALSKKRYGAANTLNKNTIKDNANITKLLKAWFADEDFKQKHPDWAHNLLYLNAYIKSNEADAIAFANVALEAKDWVTASALLHWWPSGADWKFEETATLKAWRDANASTVMTGLVDSKRYNLYGVCLFNLSKRDLVNNDKTNTETMKYFDERAFGDECSPKYSSTRLRKTALGQAMAKAFFANATDPEKVFKVCKFYQSRYQKEVIAANWAKIATGKTVAFKAAKILDDGGKMIDALLLTTDDLTAADIEYVIGKVVGFDADYRTADVAKVLKNINAKYTLRLYDDRDTWEPVLSKVRALIDCR